jgi:methionine biosynthesis protein MetW
MKNPRISPSIALLKSQKLPKNMRIIEIGCKDGGVLLDVATALNATDIYGVDIDEEALKKAAENGINVQKVDLNSDSLSFEDGFFDIVLMEEVIEHLANPDNSLQEIYRVLKLGGLFLISTPNLSWWLNRFILFSGYQPYWSECSVRYNVGKFKRPLTEPLNGHLRMYTLRALKQLLQLYGFKIIGVKGTTYNSLPSALKYINKLLTKRASLSEITLVLAQK